MRENEDTLLDGPEWSPYRQRLARAAGFRVVETPDNVIAFPQQSETPAAG